MLLILMSKNSQEMIVAHKKSIQINSIEKTVLVLLPLPHFALTLWSLDNTDTPLYHESHLFSHKENELLLPHLLQDLLSNTSCTPALLATMSEPGPFSAMRLCQSFIHGLALGWDIPSVMPDAFQIHPEPENLAVYIGLQQQWMGQHHRLDTLDGKEVLSPEKCGLSDTLRWSRMLVQWVKEEYCTTNSLTKS